MALKNSFRTGNKAGIILPILFFLFLADPGSAREKSTELYRKGAGLALNGQMDEAIAVFKQVIGLSPRYCMGHYGLGKAYLYKHGMLKDAIRHLDLAVKLDPRFVRAQFYLGMAYYLNQKYQYAIKVFAKARIEAEKQTLFLPELSYNMGAAYDDTERELDAAVSFNRYLLELKSAEEEERETGE